MSINLIALADRLRTEADALPVPGGASLGRPADLPALRLGAQALHPKAEQRQEPQDFARLGVRTPGLEVR
jgi:hypothetical protein